MSFISIDLACGSPSCAERWWDTVRRAEISKDGFSLKSPQVCPKCGEESGHRVPSAPSVVGRAAYLDGQERKGWKQLKELARLEARMSDMRGEDRKKAEEEKRKLQETLPKGQL